MRRLIYTLVGTVTLVSLLLGGALSARDASAEDPGSQKVSGLLGLQVQAKLRNQAVGPLAEGQVDILQPMLSASAEPADLTRQQIFIHFDQLPAQWQIAELEALGVIVNLDSWIPPMENHPTGFLTAEMPLDQLSALAGKSYVSRLDTAEQYFHPHNDNGAQKINADDVWTAGYNGSGVVVAVLDSGLDVTHADIPTLVDSWDYAENDATIANTVTGHGTHVTGSVLGRAVNTSGSTYNGTAPGASLVFLKIGSDAAGTASTSVMVNAMKQATDNFSADVITMSYGGWDSYHDGSSQTAQAVDYAVNQGAVVFISAGNDADDDHHYSGTVNASSSTGFIQINITGATADKTVLYFNLVWYDGTGTNNDLSLAYYDSGFNLLSSTSGSQSESSRGTESETSYYDNYVAESGSSTYYLKVTNNSGSDQFFHLYYSTALNLSGAGTVKFLSPDASYTLSSPADADSAIAVGAYTTRTYWIDYNNDGPWQLGSGQTLDEITTFSSQGPRVDSGAPGKVNLVAPGAYIISARDNDIYPWPGGASAYFIDNDGPNQWNGSGGSNDGLGPADYYVMQGTSMATPMAAGVAALLLEKNPGWTAAQVRHALESTATDDGAAGRDDVYGWGLVDALASVNSSLPATASYSDASHSTASDTFDDYGTEHTVYLYTTGLLASQNYRVAYYDGSDTKRVTDDVTSGASGNLSSQHTFEEGTDVAGSWNVIVVNADFTPPTTYNGSWAYTISSDNFTVTEAAIPEFPTVLSAVVTLGLVGVIYFWMKKKAVAVNA